MEARNGRMALSLANSWSHARVNVWNLLWTFRLQKSVKFLFTVFFKFFIIFRHCKKLWQHMRWLPSLWMFGMRWPGLVQFWWFSANNNCSAGQVHIQWGIRDWMVGTLGGDHLASWRCFLHWLNLFLFDFCSFSPVFTGFRVCLMLTKNEVN